MFWWWMKKRPSSFFYVIWYNKQQRQQNLMKGGRLCHHVHTKIEMVLNLFSVWYTPSIWCHSIGRYKTRGRLFRNIRRNSKIRLCSCHKIQIIERTQKMNAKCNAAYYDTNQMLDWCLMFHVSHSVSCQIQLFLFCVYKHLQSCLNS